MAATTRCSGGPHTLAAHTRSTVCKGAGAWAAWTQIDKDLSLPLNSVWSQTYTLDKQPPDKHTLDKHTLDKHTPDKHTLGKHALNKYMLDKHTVDKHTRLTGSNGFSLLDT